MGRPDRFSPKMTQVMRNDRAPIRVHTPYSPPARLCPKQKETWETGLAILFLHLHPPKGSF